MGNTVCPRPPLLFFDSGNTCTAQLTTPSSSPTHRPHFPARMSTMSFQSYSTANAGTGAASGSYYSMPTSGANRHPPSDLDSERKGIHGEGSRPFQEASSLPGVPGASSSGRTSSGNSSSYRTLAVSEVTGLSVERVLQISNLIQSQHGRQATHEELVDLSDDVLSGKITLPPLPPTISGNSGVSNSAQAATQSVSSNSRKDSLNSDGTEDLDSAEDSEGYGSSHNSEGEDGVDGTVPEATSGIGRHHELPRPAMQTSELNKPSLSRLNAAAHLSTVNHPESGIHTMEAEAEREPRESGEPSSRGGGVDIPDGKSSMGSAMAQPLETVKHVQQILWVLQREFEILDTSRKCSECKVKARDTTFLPCGHFMMCKECSEPIFTCPNCSKSIQATAQTYLS